MRQLKLSGLLWVVACVVGIAVAAERPRLQGDPLAVAAIERMIERFGGAEVWARARSLYVEYDGWRTRPNEPVVERAWRGFGEPYQRAEYEGRSFYTIYALSPAGGWISRDGAITRLEPDDHRATVERYPFGFYTSIHTFASGDPRIRLQWQEPRVIVSTADGRERGWWQIDETGALIKWGATTEDGEELEYVYGPMRAFGNVNFPAWGSSHDGWWRWNYTVIDVSTDPIPAAVGFEPPE